MTESDQPPSPDRLTELLTEEAREEAVAYLDRVGRADPDARKRVLRAVRSVAEDRPGLFDGLAVPVAGFLTDGDRAVRLTTAKLLVALARSEPTVVVPVVESLADRLADDEEFYYVRARCAEALGYLALEHPTEVGDPAILADLRIGLEFDEPEVEEKLAKALEFVSFGDPSRLRHQVASLAEHLDDDRDLVRYHLCTALVVVGCEHPAKLSDAEEAFRARLADESPYVRGRAAEALAVLARSETGVESVPEFDEVDTTDDKTPSFLADRARFLRGLLDGGQSVAVPDGFGTVESVRDGTDDVVEEITSPDGDGECPHCGQLLPEAGPPMCPGCGAPR